MAIKPCGLFVYVVRFCTYQNRFNFIMWGDFAHIKTISKLLCVEFLHITFVKQKSYVEKMFHGNVSRAGYGFFEKKPIFSNFSFLRF